MFLLVPSMVQKNRLFENFVRNHKYLGSGGSMVARLKLKRIDGRPPPGVELAAQFDPTRENLPGQDISRIDRLIGSFNDFIIGGAWPFLVGGVICLVYSDNERDFNLINSF